MKRFTIFCGVLLALCLSAQAEPKRAGHSSAVVKERGLHHTINEHVRVVPKDGKEQSITNRYTTLAAGMHRMENGKMVEADPTIVLHPQGAIADKTQHKVKFGANINDWDGAIDLKTSDNKRFLSRPLGISYHDRASGESVLIAELKDSVGMLFPPNKIVYQDAFTDFKADLEYNNLLAGLQQNLIFRECPPQPSEFGLNNETTVIELLTEFFDAPVPRKKSRAKDGVEDDRQLDFGSMNIGVGKSFIVGEESRSYPVEKQWTELEGRNFLIERVPYAKIATLLKTLPPTQQANHPNPDKVRHIASKKRLLPERQVASLITVPHMQVASAPIEQKGFVIDYSLVTGSLTNYVFQADKTYFVTNSVFLHETTVFEGGTVIKYSGSGSLCLYDDISCQTDAYRPAVFTSWEDDSVGEILSGSSGTPSPSDSGYIALVLFTGDDTELKHLRISHLTEAVEFDTASGIVTDCQFIKCGMGVLTLGGDLWLRNNLFYQCQTALGVLWGTIHGEHLTVNQSVNLAYDEFELKVRLTNSLLVAVANLGVTNINATNSNFLWFTNDPGIFQTIGGGSHYLAESSPYRNVGTTNINPALLSDLGKKTTYPPLVITGTVTNNTTVGPMAERDTDIPDIGYHYEPLDVLLSNVVITNSTMLLTNGGAAGWYGEKGVQTQDNGKLISSGTATNLNWFTRYNTVQELAADAGFGQMSSTALDTRSFASSSLSEFTFTGLSCLAQDAYHIQGFQSQWVKLENSLIFGGLIYSKYPGLLFDNCLIFRTGIEIESGPVLNSSGLSNCTLVGGWVAWTVNMESDFSFYNNFADQTAFYIDWNNVSGGYNGYLSGYDRFDPTDLTDTILTNSFFPYTSGALGSFYHGVTNLQDKGSQSAASVGLFHFTTQTNQIKEANSIVDLGFHYVASGTSGEPLDSDADQTPDYLEDTNGNGIHDDGEADWNNNSLEMGEVLVGRIAAGYNHNLFLQINGNVLAWGHNANGQLGDHSKVHRALPVSVTNLSDVTWLASGDLHSLAVKSNGTVWVWGSRGSGRLGDGATSPDVTNAVQISISNVVQTAAGAAHSLALKSNGTVWAWGLNSNGRLGDGTATQRTTPVQVGTNDNWLTNIISVSAGDAHSVALKSDGTVWAWGNNGSGRIGDGTTTHRTNYVQVGLSGNWLTNIASISAGRTHNLALKLDGTVWAWGDNANGRLGDGTTTDRTSPKQVTNLFNVVSISSGYGHSLALKEDGTVWAWGYNSFGQLGDGTLIQKTNATLVPGLSNVVAVAAGEEHSVALQSDGTVVAWGRTQFGQLGNGQFEFASTFRAVTNSYAPLAAGYNHSLALTTNGTVFSWGFNSQGQLGDLTKINRSRPVAVAALTNIVGIDGGELHSTAVASNGTVWAWGDNANGRLGDGTTTDRTNAVQVGVSTNYLTNVVMVSSGAAHNLAVLTNGTVWAWGLNSNGRLGDGTATQRTTPVQVGTNDYFLTNIVSVSAGQSHSLALSSEGTIYAWGYNESGRIGDGTTIHRTNHLAVGALSSWRADKNAISAGGSHSLAISTNGDVWAWGNNASGRLGDGTTTDRKVPTLIANTSDTIAVAAGFAHSMALKDDGTVWAWGVNTYGQLGDGTTTQRSVPTQVLGLTNAVAIAAGEEHSLALLEDGTIVSWGRTQNGQLGIGHTGFSTAPMVVITESPAIWQQPTNAVANLGTTATFTVQAVGSALEFKWMKDGNILRDEPNVSGENSSTLQLSNVTSEDEGSYSVLVFNPAGAVTSVEAELLVLVPPSIEQQPFSRTNMLGTMATFSIIEIGTTPLNFQWKRNGSNLVDGANYWGADTDTLIIREVSNTDSADYAVVISNAAGQITSSNASLTVVEVDGDYDGRNYDQELGDGTDPLDPISVSSVLLRHWKFEDNFWSSESGTFPLAFTNLQNVLSWSGNGLSIDSTNQSYLQYGDVDTDFSANLNCRSGTLMFWFKPDWDSATTNAGTGPGSSARIIELGDGTNDLWTLVINTNGTQLEFITRSNAVTSTNLIAEISWTSNSWRHVALVYSPSNSLLYVDGLTASTNGTAVAFYPRAELRAAGFSFGSDRTGNLQSKGTFDELKTFNYPFSGEQIIEEYSSNANLDSDGDGLTDIHEVETGKALSDYYNGQLPEIVIISGNDQIGVTNAFLPLVLTVEISGTNDIPLQNAPVVFQVVQEAGLVAWENIDNRASNQLVRTDAFGRASVQFYCPPIATASNRIQAEAWSSTNSVSVLFSETSLTQVATPQFSKTGGAFASGTEVQVTCVTAGSTIRVTFDGMEPDEGSLEISNGQTMVIDRPTTLKAKAWKTGLMSSEVAQASFSVSGAISAGARHSLGLRADGSVWSWGYNGQGQLAEGASFGTSIPQRVTAISNAVAIVASDYHSLALREDGFVLVWGQNALGQLGTGNQIPALSPTVVAGLSNVVAITANSGASYALKSNGTVSAWGNNDDYQLGDGTSLARFEPILVAGISNASAISAGDKHCLVLKTNGTVWAWGSNTDGELGDGTFIARSNAVQVVGLSNIVAIAAGGRYDSDLAATVSFSLAVDSDGYVFAWGDNTYGQSALDVVGDSSVPVIVDELQQIVSISAGAAHAIAIDSNGTAFSWGRNDRGQLGRNAGQNSSFPEPVSSVSGVVEASAGTFHTLLLKSTGSIAYFGDNTYGQAGDGSSLVYSVVEMENVDSVSIGSFHGLAVQNGYVYGWGSTEGGRLGTEEEFERATPAEVEGLDSIRAVAVGQDFSIALHSNSAVFAWGNNDNGQLGDGSTNSSTVPQLVAITNVLQVAAGTGHVLSLKSDGSIWAWGANESGALGDGTLLDRNSPVQVSNWLDVVSISCGGDRSLALKDDMTVWHWGNGVLAPLQVVGLSNIVKIASGNDHHLALESNGCVHVWGNNDFGQLGNGTNATSEIPQLVAGITNAVDVFASGLSSFTRLADGKVYAWGGNSDGQLGRVPFPTFSPDSLDPYLHAPVVAETFNGATFIGGNDVSTFFIDPSGQLNSLGRSFHSILANGNAEYITAFTLVRGLYLINWDDADYDGVQSALELEHVTNPNDGESFTPVQMGTWSFNHTWDGDFGQRPVVNTNMTLVANWRGGAVHPDQMEPAILSYMDYEETGYPNVNCRNGSLRLWFAPDWSSTNASENGSLVQIGTGATNVTGDTWSLEFNTNGTALIFVTGSGGAFTTNVSAGIGWTSNQWHQITLTYSTNKTELYIDGAIVAEGSSIVGFPSAEDRRMSGFNIGTSVAGKPAKGLIQGLETFNYVLDGETITNAFALEEARDTDGDGIPDLVEIILGINPHAPDSDGDGLTDGFEIDNGSDPKTANNASTDSDYDGRTDYQEQLDGTEANNPSSVKQVRLARFRFEDTSWSGEENQAPLSTVSLVNTNDGLSRNALFMDAAAAQLSYREVETNGSPNFNCRSGSARFWFKPSWASTSGGGTGPITAASLIELGEYTTNAQFGWWSLAIDGSGDRLELRTQQAGIFQTNCSAQISFQTNEWYQIVIVYSPTVTRVYTNGYLAASGTGVTNYPSDSARSAHGINIGNAWGGNEPVKGTMDELEFFNYAMAEADVIAGVLDVDNDGLTSLQEAKLEYDPFDADTDDDGIMDGDTDKDDDRLSNKAELQIYDSAPAVQKNLNTNEVDGRFKFAAFESNPNTEASFGSSYTNLTATLTVVGVEAGDPYDVYIYTNSTWQFFVSGSAPTIEGTTTLTNASYRLAAATDTDADGLTDGYESIFSLTNVNYEDSDGDGMPDGWEVKYGLDPLDPADATQDLDGDGVSNYLEYLMGRNPTAPGVVSDGFNLNQLNVFTPFK